MIIKNRNKDNPGEIIIEVSNLEYDFSGNITKLYGKMIRNEGEGEEGTPLNEETMSIIARGYYVKNPSVIIFQDEEQGERTDSFVIEYLDSLNFEVINQYTDLFFVQCVDNDYKNQIVVTVGSYPTSNNKIGVFEYEFKIKLKSKLTNQVVGEIDCLVCYHYASTNPID